MTAIFWWLYLAGHYTADRCPEYLREDIFARRRGLVDRISTHSMSILDFLKGHDKKVDRFAMFRFTG